METTVDMQDLAGRVVKQPFGDGTNSPSHITRLSNARLRKKTTGNALFINAGHRGNHVGLDNSGFDFKNRDVARSQASREQFRRHADGSLGHAVVAPVYGCCEGRNGADENNPAAVAVLQHQTGDLLCKEIWSANV